MTIKSSHKRGRQILGIISPSQAENLLTDWANLPGPWPLVDMDQESSMKFVDAQKRMRRRHGKFLGDPVGHLFLRDLLRRAWSTSDLREREWLCFRLRDSYASMVRRHDMNTEERRKDDTTDVIGPRYSAPPVTPLEGAIFHFQHQAKRAFRCPNLECPAPYFFVSKKGQKYCSGACAQPAQRESKRKWWQENRAKPKRRKQK